MAKKVRGNNLKKLGYVQGRAMGLAINIANNKPYRKMPVNDVLDILKKVLETPEAYAEDENLKPLVDELTGANKPKNIEIPLNDEVIPYKTYGGRNIETGAKLQMDTALRLPISRAGALMPDAHTGYGLPIGGVLATEDAIIPYAVGVDIGCRMCMSIFDIPADHVERHRHPLKQELINNTRFGMKEVHKNPTELDLFERSEFKEIKIVKSLKEKAMRQIGTSGGGNHFVEFGIVEIIDADNEFGLAPGKYMGLLTHSGSRGLGANIADHYTRLAMDLTKLPNEAKHFAWLDMNKEEGQEYWLAMNLAGDYASACHHDIHRRIAASLNEKPVVMVENHHNFAWKEIVDGKELIVHRKGATPAGKDVLGIIPGSMTAPGYIVRGKGEADSLSSASHGAGRAMSRKVAKESFTKKGVKDYIRSHGVLLVGGGVDEAPMAYKDIEKVMGYQKDLVDVVATFLPKVVRMADDSEPSWVKKKKNKAKKSDDGFLDGK